MASQPEPMEAAAGTGNDTCEPERGGAASESLSPSSAHIASEADLIAFTRLPLEERVLSPQLRGVLAESALTGRIRYKWPLLRPLVDFVLEQVLTAYDAETRVEVGPPGPDSVSETIERFQKLLSAFSDAPWTFQRLCEILLEPKRQYARLPKLVLAIEKCLLVTTEQPPTDPDQLPPPPLCSALGPVNANPAQVYTNTHHGSHGGHGAGPSGGADDSAAFTHSLLDLRHHPHHHHHIGNHVGTPEHIEEDHWPEGLPEGKGAFKAAGVGLHGALRTGATGAAGSASGAGAAGNGPAVGSSGGSGAGPVSHDMQTCTHGAATTGSHTILNAVGGTGGSGGGSGSPSSGGGSVAGRGSGGEDVMAVDSTADPESSRPADTIGADTLDREVAPLPLLGREKRPAADSGERDGQCEGGTGAAGAGAVGNCGVLLPAAAVGAPAADGDVEMEAVQDGAGTAPCEGDTSGEQVPGEQLQVAQEAAVNGGGGQMVAAGTAVADAPAGSATGAPTGTPPPGG